MQGNMSASTADAVAVSLLLLQLAAVSPVAYYAARLLKIHVAILHLPNSQGFVLSLTCGSAVLV